MNGLRLLYWMIYFVDKLKHIERLLYKNVDVTVAKEVIKILGWNSNNIEKAQKYVNIQTKGDDFW